MSARPAENIDAANIVGHFINGADVADDNRALPVTNPATGAVSRHVAMATRSIYRGQVGGNEAPPPGQRFHLLTTCPDRRTGHRTPV